MIEAFTKGDEEHIGPVDTAEFARDAIAKILEQANKFVHAATLASVLALTHLSPVHAQVSDGPKLAQQQDRELTELFNQRTARGLPFLSAVTVANKYLHDTEHTETLSEEDKANFREAIKSVRALHTEYQAVLRRMAFYYRSKDKIQQAVDVEASILKTEQLVHELLDKLNAKLHPEQK